VLNDLGIAVAYKAIVGDNRAELTTHVAHALARHRVLILTGGLGPTDDDLTREVVAAYLALPLQENAAIIDAMERRFAARGWKMPAVNRGRRWCRGARPCSTIRTARRRACGSSRRPLRYGSLHRAAAGSAAEMKPMMDGEVRRRLVRRRRRAAASAPRSRLRERANRPSRRSFNRSTRGG
jgi:nicotinamide-nucleotide amidase